MEQTKALNSTKSVLLIVEKVNFKQVLTVATIVVKVCPIPGISVIITILTFLSRFEPLIKKGVTKSVELIDKSTQNSTNEMATPPL